MTLSENKTVELTKSIFSLILIYIGIEFLAFFILVLISLIWNLLFKRWGLIDFNNDTKTLAMNCISQILGIYFFTKIYRKRNSMYQKLILICL